MKRIHLAIAAAVAIALLILDANTAYSQEPDPCNGLSEFKFFVGGESEAEFIANNGGLPEAIEDLLERIKLTANREVLGQLLSDMNSNPQGIYDAPEQLRGIGGFVLASFLQKYMDERGRVVREPDQAIASKRMFGKIRDYIFVEGPKLDRGSGHLNVDVCTVDDLEGTRQFHHWDVEVRDDEFEIRREPSPDPSRPELDHKLAAQGFSIIVHHVYFRDLDNPDLTRLVGGPGIFGGHQAYRSSPESCIDLFTEGRPPATYGELARKSLCLGRCAHPAIVNTGD